MEDDGLLTVQRRFEDIDDDGESTQDKNSESIVGFGGESDRSSSLQIVLPKSVGQRNFQESLQSMDTRVHSASQLDVQEQGQGKLQESIQFMDIKVRFASQPDVQEQPVLEIARAPLVYHRRPKQQEPIVSLPQLVVLAQSQSQERQVS
ncbi:hypothetical protein V6N13_036588 [Hibiscus sabdariffa]